MTWKRQNQGHTVEMVKAIEVIDPDGSSWWDFQFAVDGKVAIRWQIPKSHRSKFADEDAFDEYLARTAVRMSQESPSSGPPN